MTTNLKNLNRTYLSKSQLNKALYAMLGSEKLVVDWWSSPNKFWNLRTPDTVLESDPKSVQDYILSHLQK